jgi:arginyl-tRNA synthetase
MSFWSELDAAFAAAFVIAYPKGPVPPPLWSPVPAHVRAHVTHGGAFAMAKSLGLSPRVLAEKWQQALPAHPFVQEVSVAGAGYLNVVFSPSGIEAALMEATTLGLACGSSLPARSWLVEFVSANPTGPLHIGHARQAVLGDVLCRLLESQGQDVTREFYVNDAGGQINHLLRSFLDHHRALAENLTLVFERDLPVDDEGNPGVPVLPPKALLFSKDNYHGGYVQDLVREWMGLHGKELPAMKSLKVWLVEKMQNVQKKALENLHVLPFDHWASEQGFHDKGEVDRIVGCLKPHATHNAPKDGVLPLPGFQENAWVLHTTLHGDDKDRVMLKPDGSPTYFVPDMAYHLSKHERGFDHAINIQGSDHVGTTARLRAGLRMLVPTLPPGFPTVLFHTMVRVVKNGEVVKTSKRDGNYLTVDDLIGEIGPDALRVLLLQTQATSEVTLDIDLALTEGPANPVYYLQYAHARACSVLARTDVTASDKDDEEGKDPASGRGTFEPCEDRLFQHLVLWPHRMRQAMVQQEPHRVFHHLLELAAAYHEVYGKGPRVRELSGESLRTRQKLVEAFVATFRAGAALMGIDAPQRLASRPVGADPA